jgi:D-sedoheptulose 7-phosphate isomerase
MKIMPNSFVGAQVHSAAAHSSYAAYFEQLHRILMNIVVTTRGGQRLDPQQGTDKAVEMIEAARRASCKVMIVGNGGSAAIASHQAIDMWNTAGVPTITFNDAAQLTCLSNDYGYEYVFSRPIEMFAKPGDVLLAISSSGKSKNILNAVSSATSKGCGTITLSGFNPAAPLLSAGDLNFYVDSGQYGPVEVAHSALIHYLTDTICARHQGASR